MDKFFISSDKAIRASSISKSFDGKTILNNLNFDIGKGEFVSIIGDSGSGKSYIIVGILKDTPDVFRFLSHYTENDSIPIFTPYQKNLINSEYSLLIRFQNKDEISYPSYLLSPTFATKDSSTYNLSKTKSEMDSLISILSLSFTVISGLIILVIMIFSIRERYFEFGIKQAVGASKNDIKIQIIFECSIYGIIGSLIGIVIGIIISFSTSLFFLMTTGLFAFSIDFLSIFITFIFTLLITIISGLIPAFLASKDNLIKCLKVE